ncbi:HNH endonuclease [Kocuria oceani]
MGTFLRWTPELLRTNLSHFGSLVIPNDAGCWEFQRASRNPAYGEFIPVGDKNDAWLAHRISYFLFVQKPLGKDHQVDHRCMNGRCVRPDHLQGVTETENQRRRARGKPMKPLKNWTRAGIEFAHEFNLPAPY